MSDYVNNKELYEEICRWKQQIAAEGRQVPMSDQIGLAIMQISKNLSRRFNFSGYSQTWREEMIDDGIEAAAKGLINFDETKYKNPHAYITQACFNAFVQRIKKERTATAAKYKYFVHHVYDERDADMCQIADEAFIQDIYDKINNYEESVNKPKAPKVEDVLTEELPSLDKFYEIEN